jgi:hypothetical protein
MLCFEAGALNAVSSCDTPESRCRRIGAGDAMPTLVAGIVASLAGWLVEDSLSPFLGFGPTVIFSLVFTSALFFILRKWLVGLREG